MPIVRISMFEGRSVEQKRSLIREVTRAVADVCGVSPAGIHVLIEDYSRENWGRGSILHADRGDRSLAHPRDEVFFSVSRVRATDGRNSEYLDYRRDQVHPTMGSMGGFQAAFVAQDQADDHRFLLFNRWDNEAAWRQYQGTSAHDELRDKIRSELTQEMEIERYSLVDLAYGGSLAFGKPTEGFVTVSTHRVKAGNESAYLEFRRLEAHPVMASFPGFTSTCLLRSLDDEHAFLIVNQWTSESAAEAYSTSPLHDSLRSQIRPMLDDHSGTRFYKMLELE
jgi:4-oxalocrotonate tautomerase